MFNLDIINKTKFALGTLAFTVFIKYKCMQKILLVLINIFVRRASVQEYVLILKSFM
jgi:hypothetical protein